MTANKRIVFWVGLLAVITLLISIPLHYKGQEYWCNVFLAAFGSALLASATAFISYFSERKFVVEQFYLETSKFADFLSAYFYANSLDEKRIYMCRLARYNLDELGNRYAEMDFFINNNDCHSQIFEKIYKPIIDLRAVAKNELMHFEYPPAGYNNENDKDFGDEGYKQFMQYLNLVERAMGVVLENPCRGTPQTFKTPSMNMSDKLYLELNGFYLDLMYGERKAAKIRRTKNNGQA